jgi:hypothetical protein
MRIGYSRAKSNAMNLEENIFIEVLLRHPVLGKKLLRSQIPGIRSTGHKKT